MKGKIYTYWDLNKKEFVYYRNKQKNQLGVYLILICSYVEEKQAKCENLNHYPIKNMILKSSKIIDFTNKNILIRITTVKWQ